MQTGYSVTTGWGFRLPELPHDCLTDFTSDGVSAGTGADGESVGLRGVRHHRGAGRRRGFAERFLSEAVERFPDDLRLRADLAAVLLGGGRSADARAHLQRVAEQGAGTPEGEWVQGQLRVR